MSHGSCVVCLLPASSFLLFKRDAVLGQELLDLLHALGAEAVDVHDVGLLLAGEAAERADIAVRQGLDRAGRQLQSVHARLQELGIDLLER